VDTCLKERATTGYTRIAGIALSIAVLPVSSAAAAAPGDCAALAKLAG
jgi:hypothetical protein